MNIKRKNKLVIIGFIISLFLVYKFAISKTFEVQRITEKLNNEKLQLDNISEKVFELKATETELDIVLKKKNISINNSFQQTLLENVTLFSEKNKLQIIAFNEPHQFNNKIANLFTYSFEVKGSFIVLLRLVNHLENLQLGELISINFEKKKNYRSNTSYLTCKIMLQNMSS